MNKKEKQVQLRLWARQHVAEWLDGVNKQLENVELTFPGLARERLTYAKLGKSKTAATSNDRQELKLSSVKRRAISKRMKAYWAKRRAEKT